MTLKDITLPTEGIDWQRVLQHWAWLLADRLEFNVWILNRFGDLFVRLPDGSIWMLCTGSGTFRMAAPSKGAFAEMVEGEDRLESWFMPSLIEELEAAGRTLGERQCYGFTVPPGFEEGKYESGNVKVVDIEAHFIATGDLWGRLRDVPDGTGVRLEME